MRRTLTHVPDLQEISTTTIAISLWSRIHMPDTAWSYRSYDQWDWRRNMVPRVSASPAKLSLPNHFIELIQKYVKKLGDEIFSWVEYMDGNVFLSLEGKYDLNYLVSSIVWHPNGTINYKQTALNLQNSPRLSDVQKYRLLCGYCLKAEIEQKWPALFRHDAFDHVTGNFRSKYPLIDYWICHCRKTLEEIPVPEGVLSLDSYMFQHERVDNWYAKAYFFARMSVEEKLRNAVAMIEEAKNFPWQKEMLLNLSETQRFQLYMERPAEVMINHTLHDSVEDALSAWFIIRGLIKAEQFATVVKKLCRFNCEASVVIEIWRTASSEFKHCLLNSVNDESFTMFWEHCIKIGQFESYKSLLDTSEDIRKIIREKPIFTRYCKKLIDRDDIPLLERLLKFCFRSTEELAQFKHHHIHSSSWFREHCEGLLIRNIDRSKRLYEFCFCNKEEFIEFGKAFTKLDTFSSYCKKSIMSARYCDSYSFYESTWYQFLNVLLPRSEDLSEFRRVFAEKIHTLDLFQQFITDSHYEFSIKLFQELCDIFPFPAEKWAELKRRVTEEEFFLNRCTRLIDYNELNKLHEGLNYFFDTPEQCEPFRRNLIKSKDFFKACKNLVSQSSFSVSELQLLMDLITFDSTALTPAATRKSLKEFKKETIFSDRCILILRDLVDNSRFNDVKKFFDGFLDSEEDMRALRLKLCGNFECLIKKLFFEYDESVCKLWMKWWFGNKQGQQKYMRKISVDTFFNDGLKKCVFQTFGGSGRKSLCTLNKDFDFSALDRFLKWYFGSAIKAKKYKLEMIDGYESIDTINALVTKGCHASYFRKLTSFFFENDATEISKFKKKHKGERIAVMVKGVRLSL